MASPGTGVPPVVTWALLSTGAWLVYASVRGLQPLAELNAALRGQQGPGPQAVAISPGLIALDASAHIDTGEPPPNDSRQGSLTATPELVPIGQGYHRLAPATAAAFKRWEAAYGRKIIVTDSYRDYATQLAGFKKDPKRFASPDTSRHVRGMAVDVNLQTLNAAPPGAGWNALYAAATATGWCNPRGPYKGDHAEPWHFSYPGCG